MVRIVISGINIVSGGMLSIYKDCMREMLAFNEDIFIVALVHKISLFDDIRDDRITFLEFPKAKRSWVLRCWYEYVYFYKLSRRLQADIWLSIHDMSPRVDVPRQFVYCHNTSPFYHLKMSEMGDDWRFTLFCSFYKYLYRINIRQNKYIIVQQDWLRNEFRRLYHIDDIVVARPQGVDTVDNYNNYSVSGNIRKFIYPATAHTYKNIKILCEAGKRLAGKCDIEIVITIDGSEGKYFSSLVGEYKEYSILRFIGLQTRNRLFELYDECDAMLFSSKLESWGLPLSEFMRTGKPIIVADLPYAHEVLDGYHSVFYVDVDDVDMWELSIQRLVSGKLTFAHTSRRTPVAPYAKNWQKLFSILGFHHQ